MNMSNSNKLPISPKLPPPLRDLEKNQASSHLPFSVPQSTPSLEYAVRVQNDPTILVEDAASYKDAKYVLSVAELYLAIAKTTEIPLEKIKKVRINNMELAFEKLAKEQRNEYKELCKFWGIVPEEHRSKKPTNGILPHSHLNRLTRWGYFDLFFPNMEDVIDMVVRKTYTSSSMSKTEMAKYAQIFALFIDGHSLMPYDISKCFQVKQSFEKKGEKVSDFDLKESVLAAIMSGEKKGCWNASMLYHFYAHTLMQFPDGALDIDAVVYFMDLIDYEDKLLIEEFVGLLSKSVDGQADFKRLHLSPIINNLDIRALKERIFPYGIWDSDTLLFMTAIPEKQKRAYRYAYKCFEKNEYVFGKNVQPLKTPYDCRHACSRKLFKMYGYKYASSPLSVRISDPNELWMMRRL